MKLLEEFLEKLPEIPIGTPSGTTRKMPGRNAAGFRGGTTTEIFGRTSTEIVSEPTKDITGEGSIRISNGTWN